MEPLKIHCFTSGKLQTNSYVISDLEDTFCIVIDPGENPDEMIEFIGSRKIEYILLTHSHYDHISGLNILKKITDASVIVHSSEAEWLMNPSLNLSSKDHSVIVCEWPDILLNGGETIHCHSFSINAIHTPGHTPGSVCYLINGSYLFTGDTLLAGAAGPSNLPYGNRELLKASIAQRLFCLANDIVIYPGHGGKSSIGFEKSHPVLPHIKHII
ncbi:MBL fold metallo-hydrolase [Neobacillus sp. SAB-20_R2A]|uniref:MBL fold metallo-hydrolase n=1 Tax=Neobacillus sp. SAB-20_R2A TaxID=3120519 RepID=UPI003C6E06DE